MRNGNNIPRNGRPRRSSASPPDNFPEKVHPSRELIESAFSQILSPGPEPRLEKLSEALIGSEVYFQYLYHGCSSVLLAGPLPFAVVRFQELAALAIAVGWFAHEAAVEARSLERAVTGAEPTGTGTGR